MQEKISLTGGLSGEMNSTIVKLLLANHGYSDRVQQDSISSDGSMSPGKAISDALEAFNKRK